MNATPDAVERYLLHLKKALRGAAPAEQEEILSDIRSLISEHLETADRSATAVEAVLERLYAGLERADHYRGREAWIELGARVLPRAAPASARRWLALAARAKVGTGFDGGGIEQLALWSAAQRREIVLGRLAQHRREFMPAQLVTPWLLWLGWSLPSRVCPDWGAWIGAEALARQRAHALEFEVVAARDPAERAALRRTLVAWTGTSRWPEHEEVQWVFALLGRLAGEDGLRAGLMALVELRARLAA